MANTFSFDIVSDFNVAEMNNAIDQTKRELGNRYDFKGTNANLEFNSDKSGLIVVGDNEYQVEAILDIVRKKVAGRGIDQKVLDTSKKPTASNMKVTQEVSFKKGLSQDDGKKIAALIRNDFKKVKPQIQGDAIRVTANKKDELQSVIQSLKQTDFDFPIDFINYR